MGAASPPYIPLFGSGAPAMAAPDGTIYYDTAAGYVSYIRSSGVWQPVTATSGSPTGAAGGDLAGTYPNPSIKNSVSLVTPILNVATATTINKVTITAPATGSTLTIADGKTLTVSNTLTATGTDGSSIAFGTGGTVAYTANNLGVIASTTSAQLAGVISDETGTGILVFNNTPTLITPLLGTPTSGNLANCTGFPTASLSGLGTGVATFLATPSSANLAAAVTDETGTAALVFANTPTLITPILGVAAATTINKVTITIPATGSTLTIANGKTLTISNTLTAAGTDGSSIAFGTGGTVAYTSNNLGVFAATTSAQLAGVISDETGTGLLVFNNGPTLIAPILGVASATKMGIGVVNSGANMLEILDNITGGIKLYNTNGTPGVAFFYQDGAGNLAISQTATNNWSLGANIMAFGGAMAIGTAVGHAVGTLDISGLYYANGTAGVATFGPSVVTSLTVKNGLVVAVS